MHEGGFLSYSSNFCFYKDFEFSHGQLRTPTPLETITVGSQESASTEYGAIMGAIKEIIKELRQFDFLKKIDLISIGSLVSEPNPPHQARNNVESEEGENKRYGSDPCVLSTRSIFY